MAVCSLEGGLQPINFYACNFLGRIGYHDFEGVTVRAEEGERLLANLGDKRILMLKNHGPVVLGRTIAEMFVTHWSLQRACEIQLATMVAGQADHVPQEVIDGAPARSRPRSRCPGGARAQADFDALDTARSTASTAAGATEIHACR